MILWATVPYGLWQLTYHIFITVRRREKIEAGRPTSFTWLRRSYKETFLGKIVLRQPESLQEPTFMVIQYLYALLTMVPCPLWFWYRYASAAFLCFVFAWSTYNGASYYIDVFGRQFQKELEALKKEVAQYSHVGPNGELMLTSPLMTPATSASDNPNKQLGWNGEPSKRLSGDMRSVSARDVLGGLGGTVQGGAGSTDGSGTRSPNANGRQGDGDEGLDSIPHLNESKGHTSARKSGGGSYGEDGIESIMRERKQ